MNPIILLHGALGAKTQLDKIKNALEEQGRIVFSLDFSGHHGKAFAQNGFGIEVFAIDVLYFMNESSIAQADIFGYSMGGYVALWLAHQHPERVGKIITLGTKFDWTVASAEKEIRKLDPEKISLKAPAFARILETRHKPNDWKELLLRTSEMMRRLGNNPLLSEDILRSIQAHVLICLGDRDDMADRDYTNKVAGLLPRGEFRLLYDTSHPIETVAYIPFLE